MQEVPGLPRAMQIRAVRRVQPAAGSIPGRAPAGDVRGNAAGICLVLGGSGHPHNHRTLGVGLMTKAEYNRLWRERTGHYESLKMGIPKFKNGVGEPEQASMRVDAYQRLKRDLRLINAACLVWMLNRGMQPFRGFRGSSRRFA